MVLEKTLESSWGCKDISSGCSLEGLMLKPPILWLPDAKSWLIGKRADSLEKTLMQGKIEGRRRRWWQRVRWLDGITDSVTWVWMDSVSWGWTGRPGVLQFMGLQGVDHNWVTEWNWRRMSSLLLHWPLHAVSTSQSAYSGSPPIILGRSLDMLRTLWGLFRPRFTLSRLVLARKVHNYPKVHTLELIVGI